MAGLRLTMADGWKTYWRAPGDGGIPPRFGWQGSRNIAAAVFHWPVPEVDRQNGMRTIVYHDQVVIPVELSLADPGEATRMRGQIHVGICREICVPVALDFDMDIAIATQRDPAIIAALLDQPKTARSAGVTGVQCDLSPSDQGMGVQAVIDMPALGTVEDVVIEAGDQRIWVSEPVVRRQGAQLVAAAEMIHVNGDAFALDRSKLRITVLADGRAVDIQGCSGRS